LLIAKKKSERDYTQITAVLSGVESSHLGFGLLVFVADTHVVPHAYEGFPLAFCVLLKTKKFTLKIAVNADLCSYSCCWV